MFDRKKSEPVAETPNHKHCRKSRNRLLAISALTGIGVTIAAFFASREGARSGLSTVKYELWLETHDGNPAKQVGFAPEDYPEED